MEIDKLLRESVPKMTQELEGKLAKQADSILQNMNKRTSYLSAQESEEFNLELIRFRRMSQLYILQSHVNFTPAYEDGSVKSQHNECTSLVFNIERYSYETDDKARTLLDDVAEKLKAPRITDEEKRMVAQAMVGREGSGRWFKCPKGHYYYIGDCGGAMQTSRCNECNSQIGGGQHRLLETNRFAPEMDGSTRPAWPGMGMNIQ